MNNHTSPRITLQDLPLIAVAWMGVMLVFSFLLELAGLL
jgi:hypothetical protein